MDAVEFNLTVRSLSDFLKLQKNVGLVVMDGFHFIDNLDYQSQHEKRVFAAESMSGHTKKG
jgi:hypothetical protein